MELRGTNMSSKALEKVGIELAVNPYTQKIVMDVKITDALDSIFDKDKGSGIGIPASMAGFGNNTVADVLCAKRMELLGSLLKLQKLKRKLDLSRPSATMIQMIKWQQ